MRKRITTMLIAAMAALTACGHTATVYTPPVPEEEIPVEEQAPEEEIVEEEVPEEDPSLLYEDENVRVRLADYSLNQGTYYTGLMIENLTGSEVIASVDNIALDGKMLDKVYYQTGEMVVSPGLSSILSLDFDADMISVSNASFYEKIESGAIPNIALEVDGFIGADSWSTGLLHLGEAVQFDPTAQVMEIYTDDYISVYDNGETRKGTRTFAVYNKTEGDITISLNNGEELMILDQDQDSMTILPGAWDEVNFVMPTSAAGSVILRAENKAGVSVEVPLVL